MYDAQVDGRGDFEKSSSLPAGFGGVPVLPAEQPVAAALQAALMLSMLDEIDYGLLVLGPDARILLANHLARQELGGEQFVRRRQDKLASSSARHGAKLEAALGSARRGQRSLVMLTDTDGELALSFVPLNAGAPPAAQMPDAPSALVIFGKRDACEALTLHQYGKLYGLTGAEQALLPAIIRGLSVNAIAQRQCVSRNTVRTQLASIRGKTGVDTLRTLVARLASLPPIRPLLMQAQVH